MPRTSPFIIMLNNNEKRKLESLARKYTSPYCDVIRAKIILMANQGLSNKAIAGKLDIPRQIVYKWRKRFYQEKFLGLQDQPRGGRPGSFSPSNNCGSQSSSL
ncbi:MAG: helix-turn-helix domain-containing protein [Thermodesulfobacteriota bacterium]|nr:helix-turn-helix domain-containing protein [Thermodesulfobacteriota bacterium]